MKKRVMTIAHQIKTQFDTFSDALKAAWKIAKLFAGRSVNLVFAKKDGEVREAKAIALGSIETLAKGYFRFVEQVENGTQWRSCKLERMIFQ